MSDIQGPLPREHCAPFVIGTPEFAEEIRRIVAACEDDPSLESCVIEPLAGMAWPAVQQAMRHERARPRRADRDGKAHRWQYERLVGPIPPGSQLDHLCRNRACVNPAHLEPVTGAENSRRGLVAKLTWKDVQRIRASDLSAKRLAAQYGIAETHVHSILSYGTWANGRRRVDRRKSKLSDADVREIRRSWDAGEASQSALARRFGVSCRHVSGIVRGQSRKAVA